MPDTQEKKKNSWWDFVKIIVLVVVIGVIIPITNTIIAWWEGKIQEKQMEIEQRQVEWEQRQKENELAPTMKVDNKGTILLGKDNYTKYVLYNSENNLAGGKLKEINGVVIVRRGEVRVKTLWIKDAIYDVEVPFDSVQQQAIIFYKEPEEIEKKAALLKSEIEECMRKQGEFSGYEFEVRIGIVATLEYSDSNNDMKKQKYIVYLEEAPYCEVIDEETVYCDHYYLEYEKEEQGEEYMAVINEAVERILEE